MKKKLFTGFLAAGVLFTLMMAVFDQWQLLLAGYVISYIGFAGSCLFYDSFLTDVTTEERMDRISSWGYAMGYIGGSTIPFVISIAVLLIMGMDNPAAVKFSVVITSVWWLIFSIPILKNVNQTHYIEAPASKLLSHTFQSLKKTLREIFRNKTIFIFIIAYFFYIDGVDTIIKMATAYGSTIGIGSIMLLIILLVTQFVAFPFAIIYGKLAEKIGTKRTLNIGILTYCVICIVAFFMSPERDTKTLAVMFWVLAMLVGTAQGGIQALSRSYFGKIVPKNQANEFFGFYNIFGKFAAILGPILFGWISLATGKANYGVGSIIILFILGSIIFHFVPDDREM